MGRPAITSPDALLDAAEAVVLEEGAHGLTLEAIARRAGVSKGVVQNNFGTKERLVGAMVDRLAEQMSAAMTEALEKEPEDNTRAIRAFVRSSLGDGRPKPYHAAILAVVANDIKLLAPQRERYRETLAALSGNGLRRERAAVIAFATDGLWLMELLGISPLSPDEREAVLQEIIALSEAPDT